MPNERIAKDLELFGYDVNKIMTLYPRLLEPILPLSSTKISARNFLHWKEKKLVDIHEPTKEGQWVRLNIFQYVWLMLLAQLRNFGISLKCIKTIKEFAFSSDFDKNIEDPTQLIINLKKNPAITNEQIDAILRSINVFKEQGGFSEQEKIFTSRLGAEVISALLRGTKTSLIVFNKGEEFSGGFTSFDGTSSEIDQSLMIYPNIQIPIKKIIEDFFDEPKNEKNIETIGLISLHEKRILDIIKNKTFKEITIKRNNGKDVLIEVIKEETIVSDVKIKEIKRMLCLNEYNEISLVQRNSKNIYLKNKLKIIIDPIASAQI